MGFQASRDGRSGRSEKASGAFREPQFWERGGGREAFARSVSRKGGSVEHLSEEDRDILRSLAPLFLESRAALEGRENLECELRRMVTEEREQREQRGQPGSPLAERLARRIDELERRSAVLHEREALLSARLSDPRLATALREVVGLETETETGTETGRLKS